MYSFIYEEARGLESELTAWRRKLHQNPELGLDLPLTSSFVQETLAGLGIPFKTMAGGSCVVGQLGTKGRCLLLRADMDGLPMREETGLPFASQNGRMHACGHDLHTAALLGAAKILKRHEGQLKGRIKLLFQPGEEAFGGAQAVLKEGILEGPEVDSAFAVHVASTCPVGTIAYGTQAAAAIFGFKITITGKGTHGAIPQDGIDPINVGVHIYQGMQELIARECAPSREVTLTIGQFNSGTASNVIPETAVLQGTLRSFDDGTKERLIKRLYELTGQISSAFRAKSRVEVLTDNPAVCCDAERNERLAAAFLSMKPDFHMVPGLHMTGSDDFAVFSSQVPSSYFIIGAKPEHGPAFAHHNPKVCFNEKALIDAAAAYACAGLDWE